MAGSVAEERIRAKAEASLRRRWPSARIVHELQLEQGGIRIDLAAIGEDFLAVVEIKSERDVLKRLGSQVERAVAVADEVWIVAAEKHEPGVEALRRWTTGESDRSTARALREARVLYERPSAGGELVLDSWSYGLSKRPPHIVDPRCRFDLLWRDEMASALGRHFGGASISTGKLTRGAMIALAVEHMSGRELRRAVCAQLRDRGFPRADERASLAVQS